MLKKKLGKQVMLSPELPHANAQGQFLLEPIAILARRLVKKQGRLVPQVKVQWMKISPEEATWEDYEQMGENNSYIEN